MTDEELIDRAVSAIVHGNADPEEVIRALVADVRHEEGRRMQRGVSRECRCLPCVELRAKAVEVKGEGGAP